MKCSQLLFGTVTLSVVVLVYLTTSAHCVTYELFSGYNLTMGERQNKDELLYNKTIIEEKSTTRPKVAKNVQFPSEFINAQVYFITRCDVINKRKGGLVYRVSGGPGHRFVTFYLESEKYKGFEFQIFIYGHKE